MGRTEFRALWRLLRARRGRLLLGVLALGLQGLLLLPITLLVHRIFAVQIPASDSRAVLLSGLGILALYVASTVLSLVARRLILVAIFASIAVLRMQVFTRLHDLPLSWHEQQDIGQLHYSVVPDCERLESTLPSLVVLLQSVVVGVPLAITAVIVSPLLTAVVAIVTPPMLILNSRLKSRAERAIKYWIASNRGYSADVLRTMRSTRLIRTRGADAAELEQARQRVTTLRATGLEKSWASNVAQVLNGTIATVTGSLILVVGGVAVARGALALSQLLTFYAVIALLLRNVTGVSGSGAHLFVAASSLIPLQTIADNPTPRIYSGTQQVPFDGSVAFRGVTFGYGEIPVLREVDLDVAAGERVAITGRNGAGKSTVARLVLGLDRPWAGTVFASGRPLDSLDVAALCRRIGVVFQETALRSGSIRENITFGHTELTETQIAWALDAAGVTEMLDERFPDGVDTDVGDDGARLSGGQRQAISLARALLGNPRLLVLDEPTNHLDADAIGRLLRAIEAMPVPPAVLLITHDSELIGWADRVVRIDGGIPQEQPAIARRA